MPFIRAPEKYDGPFLLCNSGATYTVGWQFRSARKGGPCYVLARNGIMGSIKVLERFPLTDQGWARAWKALVKQDKAGAELALRVLAKRAAVDRARVQLGQLKAETRCLLPAVRFLGGDIAVAALAVKQYYDLRFLDDRLSVLEPGLVDVVAEFRYRDIVTVEVGGPGRVPGYTAGGAAGMAFFLGELGEAVALSSTRIQTIIRVQTTASELFFLDTRALPDAWRVRLSVPLRLIREARSLPPGDAGEPAAEEVDSPAAQLSRLASLLDAGLLTRAEFDLLKAKVIADS
jgi:hypothetical protein